MRPMESPRANPPPGPDNFERPRPVPNDKAPSPGPRLVRAQMTALGAATAGPSKERARRTHPPPSGTSA